MVSGAAVDSSADWRRPSARRRATAIALTLAAELLFLLLLLGLNPGLPDKLLPPPTALTFDLSPESPKPKSAARKPKPKTLAQALPRAAQITPPKTPPLPPSPLVAMSKSEMAAANIANLGQAPGASGDAKPAAGPGEGPGGAHLYNAEWYREPTNRELAYYLPKDGVDRGSWAQIACQTVANYHVDNCYLLGESPMGSGLARAMRMAAWQFLVRPPRLDGKPLVGSWVRIRIDFTEHGED